MVTEQLYQMSVCESMGSYRIKPRVLIAVCYSWPSLSNMPKVLAVWGGPCYLETSQCYTIYKRGMSEDPGNYEHVSLNSVPGKVTEKIILSIY